MLGLRRTYAVVFALVVSATILAHTSWAQGGDLLKRAQDAETARNRTLALELYTSAIQAKDLTVAQRATAYYRKGAIRGALGDNRQGIEDFSRSIELSPGFGNALSLRGYLRGIVGDYALAEKDHLAAIALAEKMTWSDYLPWTLQHMADLQRRRGEFAKALEYCERALKTSEYPAALLRRAWIYLDMGEAAKAKAAFAEFQRTAEKKQQSFDAFWPDEREAIARLRRLSAQPQ